MPAVYWGIIFGVLLLLLVFFLSIDILYKNPRRRPAVGHSGPFQRLRHKTPTKLKPAA
jgi:hypothetical protein